MNNPKKIKTIRVTLRRKKKKKPEEDRQRMGGGHPHYDLGIP